MDGKLVERRNSPPAEARALRRGLSAEQKEKLALLEQVGWLIRFVRRVAPGQVIAGVMDPNKHRVAILYPDGQLVEDATPFVRH
jgi:hypothetical protein